MMLRQMSVWVERTLTSLYSSGKDYHSMASILNPDGVFATGGWTLREKAA